MQSRLRAEKEEETKVGGWDRVREYEKTPVDSITGTEHNPYEQPAQLFDFQLGLRIVKPPIELAIIP